MTLKEVRKLFKSKNDTLPKREKEYQAMKAIHKEFQAKSNYYLNLRRQEEKTRDKFNIYCEAWGVK